MLNARERVLLVNRMLPHRNSFRALDEFTRFQRFSQSADFVLQHRFLQFARRDVRDDREQFDFVFRVRAFGARLDVERADYLVLGDERHGRQRLRDRLCSFRQILKARIARVISRHAAS